MRSLFSTILSATVLVASSAAMTFGGVNIAGFDFGCQTDGTCSQGSVQESLVTSGMGLAQMTHFVSKGLNAFRLPVGWQYLATSPDQLNQGNWQMYDQLVQACLKAGADMCIVDVHNYARWNGAIIGQGGPSNDQFASFWYQLAGKYANNSKVVFGVMNEPHNLDIGEWANSAQYAVTSIRKAGAGNTILLPGSDFASAGAFQYNSGAAMLGVKNPDGTANNLVFDVHQYIDADGSGTNAECTQNATPQFNALAGWLRSNGRKAMLSEFGGGNTQSCYNLVCSSLDAVNSNSDVFLGVTTWAAGAFTNGYALLEAPNGQTPNFIDQPIMTSCVYPKMGSASRKV